MKTKSFRHLTVAGTFDRLHRGHIVFLKQAFSRASFVSIGVTTERLLANKFLRQTIESFNKRKTTIVSWLRKEKLLSRTGFFPVFDIYGIASEENSLDSIIVTRETYPNACKINRRRRLKKMPDLTIIKIPLIKGEDGKIIRSTRIRYGETNRQGHYFGKTFVKKPIWRLPEFLRPTLRQPLGFVISGREISLEQTAYRASQFIASIRPPIVITVGDIVSISFAKIKRPSDIAIVDGRTKRQPLDAKLSLTKFYSTAMGSVNAPGTLNRQAIQAYRLALFNYFQQSNKQLLVISGEEDLLALPAVLFAPLTGVVAYGQEGLGIVLVSVTEEKKAEVEQLISNFV